MMAEWLAGWLAGKHQSVSFQNLLPLHFIRQTLLGTCCLTVLQDTQVTETPGKDTEHRQGWDPVSQRMVAACGAGGGA